MTRSPRSIVLPAFLAFLCWSGATPASAATLVTEENSDRLLAGLRAMRYAGPIPALTGFSPASVVKPGGLLKGGKDYTTPYRSAQGCVAFFAPLAEGEHDLGLKWEGRKCDGQPLRGEGTLSITYRLDGPKGSFRLVSVFRGSFENGMLSGKGEKANFSYEASGQIREEVYAFSGQFADGLLDGPGRKALTKAATSQPSAQVVEGNFSAGTPLGEVVFSQLRPYPGVEAETKTLIFDVNGRPLLAQPDSNGAIFFTGDALGWNTHVTALKSDWSVREAIFFRTPKETRGQATPFLLAGCSSWVIDVAGLHCQEGILIWKPAGTVHSLQASRKPFEIPMPFKTLGSPVRVNDRERLLLSYLGFSRKAEDGTEELTCSSDLTSCRGKAVLLITEGYYFFGQVAYEGGEVRPQSGLFLQRTQSSERVPAKDERRAFCKEFRTPTECQDGWLMRSEDSWTGTYVFKGLRFDARRGYEPERGGFRAAMEGGGRFLWTEDQSWADLRAEDDRFVSVRACDRPLEEGTFTCSLDDDGTVIFQRSGR